jgi:hypothetical protein
MPKIALRPFMRGTMVKAARGVKRYGFARK